MGWATNLAMNAAIFGAFFVCCSIYHWIQHRRHPTTGESAGHALWSGIFHPATLDSTKDFISNLITGMIQP